MEKELEKTESVQSHRIFYGWYILIACFVMLALNSASQYVIGLMFKPIIKDMGWSRADISLAVFTNMAVFAVAMLVMGRAYDRFGPKWVIIVSVTFLGLGFSGISRMSSLLEFHFFYGFLSGIGFSGSTALIFTSLVSKWFEKRRGLAISLALSGGRLGQFFLIPFYTDMIIGNGWKPTFLAIGLITVAVNVVLVLFIVRGDPQQLGYRPYGSEIDSTSIQTGVPEKAATDFGFREAARTRSYWFYVATMLVCGAGDFFITTHLVPFVTDYGISQSIAGNMLAWLGLMSLVGVLIAGPASDLIGNKVLIIGTFALRILLFLLIIKYQSQTVFYVFSLGFGFTLMITAVLTVTLIGKMYGFSNIGTLTGFITTIHHLAGGILAYVGGAVFDSTSSYRPVFMVYAAMSLGAIVACALIKEKRHIRPSGSDPNQELHRP